MPFAARHFRIDAPRAAMVSSSLIDVLELSRLPTHDNEVSAPCAARAGDSIVIQGDYQYRALHEGFCVQRYWHLAKQLLLGSLMRFDQGDVVLDCGCASGVIADFVAGHGAKVIGLDINAEAISFAKSAFSRPNLTFLQSPVEDIPYPPQHFSKIICLEVIEHLYAEQARSLLARFADFLAPGGTLFLTTPNYRGLWPIVEWLADHSGLVPPMDSVQHVNRYTHATLLADVMKTGLAVEKAGTFCTLAPFAAVLGRGVADRVFRLELQFNLPFGNLLYLLARKPGA